MTSVPPHAVLLNDILWDRSPQSSMRHMIPTIRFRTVFVWLSCLSVVSDILGDPFPSMETTSLKLTAFSMTELVTRKRAAALKSFILS